MMLNTLSPAAVNKGDEGCRKGVGSWGENTPGSSIASLTGFGGRGGGGIRQEERERGGSREKES